MSYQTWLKPWESLSSMTKCTHSWLVPGKLSSLLSSLLCHYFIHSILLPFIFIFEYLFNLFHVILIVAYHVAWVKEVVLWDLEKAWEPMNIFRHYHSCCRLLYQFSSFFLWFLLSCLWHDCWTGTNDSEHKPWSSCWFIVRTTGMRVEVLRNKMMIPLFCRLEKYLSYTLNPLDLLSKGGTRD